MRKGNYQGAICGDHGSYDVYLDSDSTTYGYRWGNKTDEPDYIGTEHDLRSKAGAKLYTRGKF